MLLVSYSSLMTLESITAQSIMHLSGWLVASRTQHLMPAAAADKVHWMVPHLLRPSFVLTAASRRLDTRHRQAATTKNKLVAFSRGENVGPPGGFFFFSSCGAAIHRKRKREKKKSNESLKRRSGWAPSVVGTWCQEDGSVLRLR